MKAFLFVFLPLLLAYATALQWCVDRWNAPTQYYEHCWLVPLVAAVVIWIRRRDWLTRPAGVDLGGLWLLVPALLMHLVGAALMIDSLSASSLVLAIPGAAWLALGRQRLRGLWPVLWLSLFLVPTPIVVEGWLAFYLKELAVGGGAGLANLLGADLERRGADLLLRGTGASLYVADACGGLRSLLAMATIAWCVAFFMGPVHWLRRVTLLVCAVPIAVFANVVRIAGICLFARWFGVPFAEGFGHTLANVLEWVADVAVLLTLDRVLSRRLHGAPAPTSTPVAPVTARSLGRQGAWLYAVAVPLLWLSLYRPAGSEVQRAAQLPEVVAGYTLIARTPAQEAKFQQNLPRWRELLGTGDFVYRSYATARGDFISLVALFHDTNWKSVHAPRICIEGSNMDIERDDVVDALWLGEPTTVSRIVARRRSDGRRFLTYSLFGTRSWSSGRYEDFALHHMPLALLRQNESGFLLRVETPLGDGEALTAAEQRCAAFLTALLPASREQLR
ncbi:MAG: exosortase-associated EpsI family protein [Planctomycetes bacterium]|nr:exosortase-associated EpsI family protein [Planctomycetota bacterium]